MFFILESCWICFVRFLLYCIGNMSCYSTVEINHMWSWKNCFQNAFWCPTADFNFYKIALVLGYAGNSCKVCKKWWLISNRSPEHILTGACSESDWFLIDFILSFFMFRQWTWHGPGMWINADAQRLGSSLRLSQFIVSKPTSAKRNLLISEENWYLLSDEQRKISFLRSSAVVS